MSDTAVGRQTHPPRAPAVTVAVPRRSGSSWVVLAAFAVGLAGCAAHGPAAPGPRVVWVHGDRAYVASPDSLALAPGDSLSFRLRGRSIAGGIVRSVGQGEMAAVAIASGSLTGVKDLGRLGVGIVHPTPGPMALLRLGYPSSKRGTLFFACDRVEIRAPGSPGAYHATTLSDRLTRFVRDSTVSLNLWPPSPWPDTLDARLFDDAADEEIALERGELDVAVFWPGELSAHMRSAARWQSPPMGVRDRGVVGLEWGSEAPIEPATLADAQGAIFATLNRDRFRDDLMPLWSAEALRTEGVEPSGAAGELHLEVDPRFPGHAELQRFVDRLTPRVTARSRQVARLAYYGEAIPPSLPPPLLAEALHDSPVPLFAIRCPVVCAPELRGTVAALHPDWLVNLLDCRPPDRKP